MHTQILVTGATGFIGGAVLRALLDKGLNGVRAAVRSPGRNLPPMVDAVVVPGLGAATDWATALSDVTVVIHAAARVHVMRETSGDPLAEFRAANVEGTLALARQAADAGVRRFIFISSIKVNGEATAPGHAFSANDEPAPEDAYGVSKYEAEQGLLELARSSGMEVVIIRPPLVYGPGVKGNFASMVRWVERGIPLPLARVRHNRRSLVGLDNLVDLILTCIDHPAAANQVFLAGDGEDLSTAGLLARLGVAMGRRARLFPVPVRALEFAAALVGKRQIARRLLGSLQVDISKNRELLGWAPVVTVDEGLRRVLHEDGGTTGGAR